jgi:hypothetical protein
MALYTCSKYVEPQEVWEYPCEDVSACEKVCVGGKEGVETFHFKKPGGEAKTIRIHPERSECIGHTEEEECIFRLSFL